MRTVARETLFKIVFASQFTGEVNLGLKNSLYKLEKVQGKDVEYCDAVLKVIEEHGVEFARELDSRSKMFPEARMFPADKSILLISMAEILYFNDIPDKVSLNEAANIASKYSSAKSATFITGILSAVAGGKSNV